MEVYGIGQSDIGLRRQRNEDAFFCNNKLGLYLVCDGMGGHAAGDRASRITVETVVKIIKENIDVVERARKDDSYVHTVAELMVQAIRKASYEVYRAATDNPGLAGMGTTAIATLAVGKKMVMANVGDSRLYLWRKGQTHQLSNDHTIAAELVRGGVIKPGQEVNHRLSHVLTRSVGTQESVMVDTLVFDMLDGDRLLLCSDGFSNALEGKDQLKTCLDGDFESIPEELIDIANTAGGKDNITVVVLTARERNVKEKAKQIRSAHISAKLDALGRVFSFRHVKMSQLMRILAISEEKILKAGEIISERGSKSDCLFVVLEGALSATKDGVTVKVKTGESMGDQVLLREHISVGRLRALEYSKLLVIKRDPFWQLLQRRPWLGMRLLAHMGAQLCDAYEEARNLMKENDIDISQLPDLNLI